MDTYCKFYKKTSKIFLGILGGILGLIIPCVVSRDAEMSTFMKLCITILPFIGGLTLFTYLLDLFADTPYIEITPLFIKIRGAKKLPWHDVRGVRKQELYLRHRKIEILYFDLRNPLKYKTMFGHTLFQIQLDDISEEDQRKLKLILKKQFPSCRLD